MVCGHWARISKYLSTVSTSLIARFMGPVWGRHVPCGPYDGPMNLTIWDGAFDWFVIRSVLFRSAFRLHFELYIVTVLLYAEYYWSLLCCWLWWYMLVVYKQPTIQSHSYVMGRSWSVHPKGHICCWLTLTSQKAVWCYNCTWYFCCGAPGSWWAGVCRVFHLLWCVITSAPCPYNDCYGVTREILAISAVT